MGAGGLLAFLGGAAKSYGADRLKDVRDAEAAQDKRVETADKHQWEREKLDRQYDNNFRLEVLRAMTSRDAIDYRTAKDKALVDYRTEKDKALADYRTEKDKALVDYRTDREVTAAGQKALAKEAAPASSATLTKQAAANNKYKLDIIKQLVSYTKTVCSTDPMSGACKEAQDRTRGLLMNAGGFTDNDPRTHVGGADDNAKIDTAMRALLNK